jgi:hypothetical protein
VSRRALFQFTLLILLTAWGAPVLYLVGEPFSLGPIDARGGFRTSAQSELSDLELFHPAAMSKTRFVSQ